MLQNPPKLTHAENYEEKCDLLINVLFWHGVERALFGCICIAVLYRYNLILINFCLEKVLPTVLSMGRIQRSRGQDRASGVHRSVRAILFVSACLGTASGHYEDGVTYHSRFVEVHGGYRLSVDVLYTMERL